MSCLNPVDIFHERFFPYLAVFLNASRPPSREPEFFPAGGIPAEAIPGTLRLMPEAERATHSGTRTGPAIFQSKTVQKPNRIDSTANGFQSAEQGSGHDRHRLSRINGAADKPVRTPPATGRIRANYAPANKRGSSQRRSRDAETGAPRCRARKISRSTAADYCRFCGIRP